MVVKVQSLLDNFNFCIFVFTWTAVSGWQIVTMTDYSEGKWNIQQLLISRNMDWNHYSFVWLEWGKKTWRRPQLKTFCWGEISLIFSVDLWAQCFLKPCIRSKRAKLQIGSWTLRGTLSLVFFIDLVVQLCTCQEWSLFSSFAAEQYEIKCHL